MALHSAAQTEGREVVKAFRVPPRLSQHRDEYFFQAEATKQMSTDCTLRGLEVLFIHLMLYLLHTNASWQSVKRLIVPRNVWQS